MIQLFLILCASLLVCTMHRINGVGIPSLSLGSSSFLDGGPLRPKPGLYWQQYLRYYHADESFDFQGESIGDGLAPDYNALSTTTQFSYQYKPTIESEFQLGLNASLSAVLYSHITHNQLSLSSSGSGLGNLSLGPYVQFDATKYKNGSTFMHRIEFDIYFPTAKNVATKSTNPGSKFFYIDPYWAFTFHITDKFATSARFYYLYCGKNHKTNTQAGMAIHGNYSLEYQASSKVWIGLNNYFLKQLTNNKSDNINIPDSKERILATGIGALYKITTQDRLFINLYFEYGAKNRFQGMLFQLRFYKWFD